MHHVPSLSLAIIPQIWLQIDMAFNLLWLLFHLLSHSPDPGKEFNFENCHLVIASSWMFHTFRMSEEEGQRKGGRVRVRERVEERGRSRASEAHKNSINTLMKHMAGTLAELPPYTHTHTCTDTLLTHTHTLTRTHSHSFAKDSTCKTLHISSTFSLLLCACYFCMHAKCVCASVSVCLWVCVQVCVWVYLSHLWKHLTNTS